MQSKYDFLIVGAGLFGAVVAHELAERGKRVLVVDKRGHAGGNLYCRSVEGIPVHAYGAHIFHTDKSEIWDYVCRLGTMNHFVNAPLARFGDRLYNLPFNMNTFHRLFGVITPEEARERIDAEIAADIMQMSCKREQLSLLKLPSAADIIKNGPSDAPRNLEEQALRLCGRTIYETLIKGYTEKQWGKPATELPAFIIRRVPLRFTFDNNYFNDPFQGIPVGGYNGWFDRLLAKADVRLGTDFMKERGALEGLAKHTVFTGCIDEYFDFRLGRLDYRSLRFEEKVLPVSDFQGNAVVNYTEARVPYTRVIEHKHFECGRWAQLPVTAVTYEYPDSYEPGKTPYYPINDARNTALYNEYKALAANCPGVTFGGRLGQYAYYDMDDTIAAALAAADELAAI